MRTTTLEGAALESIFQDGWLSEQSENVQRKLLSSAFLVHYNEGEFFYNVGDVADGLYGVVSGTAQVAILDANNDPATMHIAQPGFWIGDLASFSNQKRLVSVKCSTEVTAVRIKSARLNKLTQNDSEMWKAFYMLSHRNTQALLAIISSMLNVPPRARVLSSLERMGSPKTQDGCFSEWINVTQKQLATLVGVSYPTVQRALKELEQEQSIEIGYGRIRLIFE
ncbi:MAG: Crp/Fnr family transcriptional regulator [Pseudoruegeria sp.]